MYCVMAPPDDGATDPGLQGTSDVITATLQMV